VFSASESRHLFRRFVRRLVLIASAAIILIALCPNDFAQDSVSSPDDKLAFCDQIDVAHPEVLADACRFALSLRRQLPNVVCDQNTYRYLRPGILLSAEKLEDRLTAHVIYEDGHERYSDVRVNGKPLERLDTLQGQFTAGEYGTDLVFAFSPENHPFYKFLHKDRVHSHHAFVYEAEVAPENNHSWGMQANKHKTYPEFVARLWLDETSHQILRVELKPVPEKGFPMSDVQLRTDYEDLALGDGTSFVLPIKSQSGSCLWNDLKSKVIFCSSNTLEFKNCHKFRARSRIVTDLNGAAK